MNKIFLKIALIFIIPFCFSYAQNSVITIHGTGDPNTSAHIKIGAQGDNKSYIFTGEIIVEDGASLVAWSPSAIGDATTSGDGEVVFLSELPDYYDLYLMDLQTKVVSQLTSVVDAGEYNPCWSPDDSKIAHDVVRGDYPYTDPGEDHSIYVTDVKTGVSTPLIGAEGGNDAAWSPDGLTIAFDRSPLDGPNIYTVPATGGTKKLLVEDAVDPEWSPEGNRIIFHRPTTGEILTVNRNGHNEKFVAVGEQPVWSPDTLWIAYVHDNDIWKVRVNTGGKQKAQPINLTNDPGIIDGQPSWSKDSKTIFFHSYRNGDADIYTISASGGTPIKLTGLIDYGDYDPSLSNLDEKLAYSGFTEPVIEKQTLLAELMSSANPNEMNEVKESSIANSDTMNEVKVSSNENPNVINEVEIPDNFQMAQNYPNPFNPITTIRFAIPHKENVLVEVYNTAGQTVRTLVNTRLNSGYHEVTWDASKMPSGIYFYRIKAGQFQDLKKMILMK